jgi:hypothetical protein
MPRLTLLLVSLMLGAGCAVLISSCGGDEGPETGIPQEDADNLVAELDRARAAFSAGDCLEVEETAQQLQDAAAGLAAKGVDAEVTEGIDQGAAHLGELASTSPECEEQEPPTTTTDEDKTETEPTTTTTATPTTTEETTTTTPIEEEEPEEDDGPPPPPPNDTGPPPPQDQGPGGPPSGGTGDGD